MMKIVSLFSGVGGLDLGIINAGHKVIWAIDNDADAVATYKKNIGEYIVCDDIQYAEIHSIPGCDVIIGGFPCQGFSLANMRRSIEDERNILYRYFYAVVKEKQPMYFIAENVRGILSLGKGEAIKQIIADFSKAGYDVKHQLFNLANYGVPQTRQRVIIVGKRKDLPIEMDFIFPVPTHSKNGSHGKLPWVTISEALSFFPEPGENNGTYLNHVCSLYKVEYRNFTGHRQTDPNKPSPTILARGNGKGGVCAIPHYNGKRRLTLRESATIQTFPLNFEFIGAMNSCYRQIGNAVPVVFAQKLGKELARLEHIQENQS